jgi:hypothetical protein
MIHSSLMPMGDSNPMSPSPCEWKHSTYFHQQLTQQPWDPVLSRLYEVILDSFERASLLPPDTSLMEILSSSILSLGVCDYQTKHSHPTLIGSLPTWFHRHWVLWVVHRIHPPRKSVLCLNYSPSGGLSVLILLSWCFGVCDTVLCGPWQTIPYKFRRTSET